jgi:cytochrome c-type biogenesis protein CcmH/NrfG
LAKALMAEGKEDDGIAAARKAYSLVPQNPEVQATLAWMLATADDISLRDGKSAVRLASEAIKGFETEDPRLKRVLAAALAADAEYPMAIEAAEEGLSKTPPGEFDGLRGKLEFELALYRRDKGYSGHGYEDWEQGK